MAPPSYEEVIRRYPVLAFCDPQEVMVAYLAGRADMQAEGIERDLAKLNREKERGDKAL